MTVTGKSPVSAERVRITAQEVASSLGVSISTVSRAFTPGAIISPETKRMVLERASQLGYRPNTIARGLSTQRTGIVGIALSDLTNPFYPEVLEALVSSLQTAGLRAMLFTVGSGDTIDAALPTLLEYQPDAVIIMSAVLTSEMAERCIEQGVPALLFNRTIQGASAAAVCCDNVAGGRDVAALFLEAGHQRLAYISGRENTSTNAERWRGFRDRARQCGVRDIRVEPAGGYSYEGGYRALKQLFSTGEAPDAVFCANDIVALGALDAARRELGIRVPEDLSIVGFDDISQASWPAYALTTVRQPVETMIIQAVEMIRQLLRTPERATDVHLIPGTVIRRASARLPNA